MVEKWSKDTYSNSIRDTNHQFPCEQCATSLIIKEMQVKILWDDFCHMSVFEILLILLNLGLGVTLSNILSERIKIKIIVLGRISAICLKNMHMSLMLIPS